MTGETSAPRWVVVLTGKAGLWGALAWGFAEGTLFFVVPDVLFTLTTLLRPRRGLVHAGAAVLGATAAGALMYAWAARAPAPARSAVATVPYVGAEMIAATDERWRERGARALFDDPAGGVPYKVYAVLAPARMPAAWFVTASIPMRAERMALTWIPFALVGALLGRFVRRRGPAAVALHAAFWITLYAYYWRLV